MLQLTLPEELSRKYTEWAVVLVDALRGARRTAIVAHKNADPDALGTAAVIHEIVRRYSDSCILLPEGPSRVSKHIMEFAGWTPPQCSDSVFDIVIAVDSSNPVQLGEYQELLEAARVIVVDHHHPAGLAEIAELHIGDPSALSASEIAILLAHILGVPLAREAATMGLAGIVYDTRRYTQMSPTSMLASTIALLAGARLPDPLLRPQQERRDFSERYARVKAASRSRVTRVCKDVIVAVTHVGSFESSAARGLLDLGADVAVVVSDKGREFRASVRVSQHALAKGVQANIIATYLAEKYGGEGGGHSAAAFAHLKPFAPSVEEAVEDIARRLPGKIARFCIQNQGSPDG